jgi:radical SAM pair-associated protein
MPIPEHRSDSGRSPTEFTFDLSLYRLSAIQKAAYRFTGPFRVELDRVTESQVRVKLVPHPGNSPSVDPNTLPNEVLDQELRETVADETRGVRELLLAQAFSNLPLTDPVGENADYRDDPLKIAEIRSPSH